MGRNILSGKQVLAPGDRLQPRNRFSSVGDKLLLRNWFNFFFVKCQIFLHNLKRFRILLIIIICSYPSAILTLVPLSVKFKILLKNLICYTLSAILRLVPLLVKGQILLNSLICSYPSAILTLVTLQE